MSNNNQHSTEDLDMHSYVPLICKTQTINIKIMNNEIKQTAVEWYAEKSIILFDNLRSGKITFKIWFKEQALLLEQAKEMEKKQIVDGIVESMTKKFRTYTESGLEHFIEIAEQHYNETYGGNNV